MSLLGDIRMYTRFTAGLPKFLRETTTLEDSYAILRQRLQEREPNFLRVVRKGIYEHPRSPYLPLLNMAGCEYGDLEQSVRTKGIEPTLRQLLSEGVYVGFEEFKGRKPLVRNGKTFSVSPHDFDNPHLKRYYYTESGGSTGAGTRVSTDLDKFIDRAPARLVFEHVHGLLGIPRVAWSPILPGHGFNGMLGSARMGYIPVKWFSPITHTDLHPTFKYRAATWYLVTVARLLGVPIPQPEIIHIEEAGKIARAVAEILQKHGKARLSSYLSLVVRVCVAAGKEGIDFNGVLCTGGGEAPTPAKMRQIKQVGARYIPSYALSEAGGVGFSCVHPIDENDLHHFHDATALIEAPSAVPGSDLTVNGFYLTSLLASSPKLLFNFESHDYGVVEDRKCGCPLEEIGFTRHIRDIRSVSKLTGEGMTLIGSDLIRIIEDVLPARFGGSALDYQFNEEEDDMGFTRLSLSVHPNIALTSEQEVINVVLSALPSSSDPGTDLGRAMWTKAKTIRIKRAAPVWTKRGKLMALHMDKAKKVQPAS